MNMFNISIPSPSSKHVYSTNLFGLLADTTPHEPVWFAVNDEPGFHVLSNGLKLGILYLPVLKVHFGYHGDHLLNLCTRVFIAFTPNKVRQLE